MDVGILIVRLVVGLLIAGHGLQKLLGWFGGPGVEGFAGMLDSLGYRKPRRLATVGALTETIGGSLFVLGLFFPAAAAMIIGMMVNAAVSVHAPNGLWVSDGGFEYNLALAAAAGGLAFTGPGSVSLDAAFGITWGATWGVVAILLGLAVAAAVLAMREVPTAIGAGNETATDEGMEERRAA